MTYLATLIGANLFLKATFILATTAIVTSLLRRSSAATRHAIWSFALVALVALPVIDLVLPSWRLDSASVSTTTTTSVTHRETAELMATTPPSASSAAVRQSDAPRSIWDTELAMALIALWMLGSLYILTRLAFDTLHVSRMTAGGTRAKPFLRNEVLSVARALGCHASIRVLTCDEMAIPASSGLFQPVILFPSDVDSWPAERLHAVIVHEVAHIKRRDYAFHLVAEIARAIYWMNPLVWWAVHRSGIERERACDDVALRSGVTRDAYATRLLEIARLAFHLPNDRAAGAIAMARRSGLSERVKSILAHSTDRAPLGAARLAVIIILVAAIALPVAALQIVQERPPTVAELIEDLRSDDVRLARRAAWWLGEREDPTGVDALIESLRSGHPDVQLVAAWALGEIKDPRAIDALSAALKSGDPLLREMGTLSLGETEHPSAVRPLMNAFTADQELRAAAYWALGEIQTEEAKTAQQEAAIVLGRTPAEHAQVWSGRLNYGGEITNDVSAHIRDLSAGSATARRAAAHSLGALGALEAVDHLLDALRDPDPGVRAMAVWALDEINPSRHD